MYDSIYLVFKTFQKCSNFTVNFEGMTCILFPLHTPLSSSASENDFGIPFEPCSGIAVPAWLSKFYKEQTQCICNYFLESLLETR